MKKYFKLVQTIAKKLMKFCGSLPKISVKLWRNYGEVSEKF